MQRGAAGVAQQQQLVQARQILGAAGNGDARHQAELPKQIALRRQQRAAAAGKVVGHPPARHGAVDVAVAAAAAQLGELRNRLVGQPQRAVARKRFPYRGAAEQMELHAGACRQRGVQRAQDPRHLLVGAGLGTQLQAEAERVPVHEHLPLTDVGGIGQPGREGGRLAQRIGRPPGSRKKLRGGRAGQRGVQIGDEIAQHVQSVSGRCVAAGGGGCRRRRQGRDWRQGVARRLRWRRFRGTDFRRCDREAAATRCRAHPLDQPAAGIDQQMHGGGLVQIAVAVLPGRDPHPQHAGFRADRLRQKPWRRPAPGRAAWRRRRQRAPAMPPIRSASIGGGAASAPRRLLA